MQENLFFKTQDGILQHDKIDFESCRLNTVELVQRVIKKYNPHNRDMVSDVAWDCFTTIYLEKLFHKYDSTKAKQRTLLYAGVRNYLIDKERSECRKINPISENSLFYENFSFFDIIDNKVSGRIADISRYLDMLEIVQDDLRNIIFKERGRKAIIEGIGELGFDCYAVMYLKMIGYSFVEIADLFNLSSSYVRIIYRKAVDLIHNKFSDDKVSVMEESDTKEQEISSIYVNVSKEELKGTPVFDVRVSYRRRFILLCKGLIEGRTLKAIYIELGIGDCTAVEWKKKYISYFKGKIDVLQEVNRWLMVVKE